MAAGRGKEGELAHRFPARMWPEFRQRAQRTDGLSLIDSVRRSLGIPVGQNIAFAEVNVGGQVYRITGISGSEALAGFAPVPTNPVFMTRMSGAMTRALDSEVKILELLASRLPANARGTISLFTERAPCFSCRGVIEQFMTRFPNIRLIVTHGAR